MQWVLGGQCGTGHGHGRGCSFEGDGVVGARRYWQESQPNAAAPIMRILQTRRAIQMKWGKARSKLSRLLAKPTQTMDSLSCFRG